MRHNLRLEGYAFVLRPVERTDAEFIVEERTSDPLRVRYLHPISKDVQEQRDWLTHYFERDQDYYWVIERIDAKEREGLIGIYDLDLDQRTAEWGRWVLKSGSLAAVESALLIYRVAFELLNLASLYCVTVADNGSVLSFHDSCGVTRVKNMPGRFELSDGAHDGVMHRCRKEDWPAVQSRLEPLAKLIARRLKQSK